MLTYYGYFYYLPRTEAIRSRVQKSNCTLADMVALLCCRWHCLFMEPIDAFVHPRREVHHVWI